MNNSSENDGNSRHGFRFAGVWEGGSWPGEGGVGTGGPEGGGGHRPDRLLVDGNVWGLGQGAGLQYGVGGGGGGWLGESPVGLTARLGNYVHIGERDDPLPAANLSFVPVGVNLSCQRNYFTWKIIVVTIMRVNWLSIEYLLWGKVPLEFVL